MRERPAQRLRPDRLPVIQRDLKLAQPVIDDGEVIILAERVEREVQPEALLTWQPGPGNIKLPSMTSEKRDFLDAVKSRRQPQYNAEGGHRNASLSHLALASMALGRKLKWDPAAEKVIGDEEANKLLQPKPLRAPWTL